LKVSFRQITTTVAKNLKYVSHDDTILYFLFRNLLISSTFRTRFERNPSHIGHVINDPSTQSILWFMSCSQSARNLPKICATRVICTNMFKMRLQLLILTKIKTCNLHYLGYLVRNRNFNCTKIQIDYSFDFR